MLEKAISAVKNPKVIKVTGVVLGAIVGGLIGIAVQSISEVNYMDTVVDAVEPTVTEVF